MVEQQLIGVGFLDRRILSEGFVEVTVYNLGLRRSHVMTQAVDVQQELTFSDGVHMDRQHCVGES